MKKILVFILFFISTTIVNAETNTFSVEFSKCVDGDTAKFIYKDNEITARFLAIDTPETVHPTKEIEEYGKDASEYTCNELKKAKKIKLEYDEEAEKTDKYDRHLVWVFVDNNLLQTKLVNKGYASIAYVYGDYKYIEDLKIAEKNAKENKIGIWNNENNILNDTVESNIDEILREKNKFNLELFIEEYKDYIILIGMLIIVSIFNLKSKNKVKRKLKNKIKRDIKKGLK